MRQIAETWMGKPKKGAREWLGRGRGQNMAGFKQAPGGGGRGSRGCRHRRQLRQDEGTEELEQVGEEAGPQGGLVQRQAAAPPLSRLL